MVQDRREEHVAGSDNWEIWLDGELAPTERQRLEAHLAVCPDCRRAADEWQAVRQSLAAYALPPEPAGAAGVFWQRLAPRLPERAPHSQADPALHLTPVLLIVGFALSQGLWATCGALALLANWPASAARLPSVAAELLSVWAGHAATGTGWGWAFALAGRWLASLSAAGWSELLLATTSSAAGWLLLLVGAVFYAAWVLLWLRPARAPQVSYGG